MSGRPTKGGSASPGGGARIVALAGAVVALAAAAWCLTEARAYLASERDYGLGQGIYGGSRNSNLGRVELKRALDAGHENPHAQFLLASLLLQGEQERASRGRPSDVSQETLKTCAALLAETKATYLNRGHWLRLSAELADFEGQLAMARGDGAGAAEHWQRSAKLFRDAQEVLPQPRDRRLDFYGDAAFVSAQAGRMSDAAMFLRARAEQEGASGARERLDAASQAGIERALGNWPQMVAALRAGLWSERPDERLAGQVADWAVRTGTVGPVRAALAELERRQRLTPRTAAALEALRRETGG